MKKILIAASVIMASAFVVSLTNWKVKPGTKVNFNINGALGVNVNGTFAIKDSKIVFDSNAVSKSSINATVLVGSVNTDNKKRDKHLVTADFFDATHYPVMTFRSTDIEKSGTGTYNAKGNLTIKKTTRPVTIPFSFQSMDIGGKFSSEFTINRLDYGVGKESMMVGNEVTIKLDIPVKK